MRGVPNANRPLVSVSNVPSYVKLGSHSIVPSPVQTHNWLLAGVPTFDTFHPHPAVYWGILSVVPIRVAAPLVPVVVREIVPCLAFSAVCRPDVLAIERALSAMAVALPTLVTGQVRLAFVVTVAAFPDIFV